jgi:hypothetical protein
VGLASARVNKQRRFAALVSCGLTIARAVIRETLEVLDLALQIPEESIPDDVVGAAVEYVDWGIAVIHRRELFCYEQDAKRVPAWVQEWLEREGRPNPFA